MLLPVTRVAKPADVKWPAVVVVMGGESDSVATPGTRIRLQDFAPSYGTIELHACGHSLWIVPQLHPFAFAKLFGVCFASALHMFAAKTSSVLFVTGADGASAMTSHAL